MISETQRSILDSERMLKISRRQLKEYLYSLNYTKDKSEKEVSTLEVHKWLVAKEKAIYNALNMMKSRKATYIGFLWAPYEMQTMINEGLRNFQTTEFSCYRNNPDEPHQLNPPTFFKLNDVTWFFQEFVNTYGVPAYMEANPAPFCIVTFPFMFGIMFGDYGHGSLLFAAGLAMCFGESYMRGTAAEAVLKIRYCLLLMGMFAMFNGLLYNEFFAIPNDWFGSCYNMTVRNTTANNFGATATAVSTNFVYPPNLSPAGQFHWVNQDDCTDPNPETGASNSCDYPGMDCVYSFGVDPAWWLSPNLLTYVNAIKMRMSVIIGVTHMSMGICVKGLNAIYNGKWLVVIFEVLTGLIILLGLFGWMDLLIIWKWAGYPVNAFSTAAAEVSKL